MKSRTESKGKRGPQPDRLVVNGDWKGAMEKALGKKRPAAGWPKPAKKKPARPKGR